MFLPSVAKMNPRIFELRDTTPRMQTAGILHLYVFKEHWQSSGETLPLDLDFESLVLHLHNFTASGSNLLSGHTYNSIGLSNFT